MRGSPGSVILYPEDVPADIIYNADRHGTGRVFVVAMTEASSREWNAVAPNVQAVPFRELRRAERIRSGLVDDGQSSEFADRLLSDPRTFFMMLRQWCPGIIDVSVFNLMPQLHDLCFNTLALLQREQPNAVVFRSTPHLVEAWVLANFAQYLSIPVLIAARGVLPGQSVLVQGVDEQRIVAPSTLVSCPHDVEMSSRYDILDYMRIMTTRHVDATPSAHRSALRRSPSGGWSLRAEGHAFRKHVRASSGVSTLVARTLYGVRRSATRRALWREYTRRVEDRHEVGMVITLFLHYQPERTTLPEAGRYGNQYELARAIALAMPDGWTLRVREHPATFVGPGSFHPMFRSPALYGQIASLPRTQLVPLDADPFTLIDESAIVATCTGTVGLESLCRGTPVIVAGLAPYRDAPGTLALEPLGSDDALRRISRFCHDVADDKTVVSRSALEDYLVERSLRSYRSGDLTWTHDPVLQERAHGHALRDALEAAI